MMRLQKKKQLKKCNTADADVTDSLFLQFHGFIYIIQYLVISLCPIKYCDWSAQWKILYCCAWHAPKMWNGKTCFAL